MRALALLAPLALAACIEPTPPATPPVDADLCKASGYQGLVGQSRNVLAPLMLPAGSRVIAAGDAVTADFRADRLNIELDTSGRIAKVSCF